MEAEAGEARNSGSLVEHVEVAEGELLSHGLADLEKGLVLLLVTIVVAELDRT